LKQKYDENETGTEVRMAARKKTAKKFSVTKAVKANARERLGQPPAERVIHDKPATEKRKAKHKETLADILGGDPE
jgi:hypothetical protein